MKKQKTIAGPEPWRQLTALCILCVALVPYFGLLQSGFAMEGLNAPFWGALIRSMKQGGLTLAIALMIGWPLGTLLGLAKVPGWRLLLCGFAVPVLTPTFLWAIGVSSLQGFFAYKWRIWFDGLPGAVWASTAQALPCVVLGATLGTVTIPASVRDATLLALGHRGLFRHACIYSLPIATGAGLFAVTIGLADPGVSQIMGYHGIASEILIAVGAQFNFSMACSKAFTFSGLLTLVAAPLLWSMSNKWAMEFAGKNSTSASLVRLGWGAGVASAGLWLMMLLVSVPPLIGLIRPLIGSDLEEPIRYFVGALRQAGPTTAVVAVFTAIIATAAGMFLGVMGRGCFRTTRSLLFGALLFLALPISLYALGFSRIVTMLPPFFDPLTRGSTASLSLCLGMKFLPVSMLLFLHAHNQRSVSQDYAASLHGISRSRYLLKVWIPQMSPTFLTSLILVALLTVTEVAGTLTLQPAGEATMATRLFAVLDNASERSLALWSLGLMIFATVVGILTFMLWTLLQRLAGRSVI